MTEITAEDIERLRKRKRTNDVEQEELIDLLLARLSADLNVAGEPGDEEG